MTDQTQTPRRRCPDCGEKLPGGQDDPIFRCRECYDERIRDLVWKNRDVIDFTGFEDIEEDINRAVNGS